MTEKAGGAPPATTETTTAAPSGAVSVSGTGEPGAALAQAPGAAGAAAAPTTPAPAAADGASAKPANGTGEPPATTAPDAAKAYWPDDWKQTVAKDPNSAFAKWVSRYGSPEAALIGGHEAVTKIRSGEYARALPKDAPPEQVAEWRKANGIPETPDAYQIDIPEPLAKHEGMKTALEATITALKPVFHGLNMSAAQAAGLSKAYLDMEAQTLEARTHEARQQTDRQKADVAREYGHNYENHMRLAAEFMRGTLGEEPAEEVKDIILANGTRLGDHPLFIRLVTQSALNAAADGDLIPADNGGGGAGTLGERLAAAVDLRYTDPKKFHTEEHQKLVDKLSAQVARQNAAA